MATTFEFDEWLDEAEPSGHEDVYALYQAVDTETEFAGYKCVRANNGKLIVSAHGAENQLILVSEAAKEGFLKRICGRYGVEGDIGGWYIMMTGLSKDD